MSKKRQKVSWDKHNKQWVKTIQGKRYYLGAGRGSSDRESRSLAILRLEEIERRLGLGIQVDTAKEVPSPKKKTKRKKTTPKRRYDPKLVKTVVRKFLKDKMSEAVSSGGQDLTYGRVQNLKNRLQHFVDHFGDRRITTITSTDLTRWVQKASKRVEKGEIKPSTLRQDFVTVKQLFTYAYEEEIIRERPRNLKNLGRQSKTQRMRTSQNKRHLFFDKQEVQLLYKSCNKDAMDSKWKNRKDTEYELLQLCIVLALNTGMTQQDLSDLTVADLYLKKRPPRLIRQRSKTGMESNHLLWRKSVAGLKEWCEGKKMTDKVFTRRDGRDLITFSTKPGGKKTGGRSDVLGASFRRLVQRVLGKDDPRRFRELRRTGANMCKQRKPGTEDLYLSHAEGKMSSFYTVPIQKDFDLMLTYLEMDLGFTDKLQRLPTKQSKKRSKTK